jgi:hypothetical protein
MEIPSPFWWGSIGSETASLADTAVRPVNIKFGAMRFCDLSCGLDSFILSWMQAARASSSGTENTPFSGPWHYVLRFRFGHRIHPLQQLSI